MRASQYNEISEVEIGKRFLASASESGAAVERWCSQKKGEPQIAAPRNAVIGDLEGEANLQPNRPALLIQVRLAIPAAGDYRTRKVSESSITVVIVDVIVVESGNPVVRAHIGLLIARAEQIVSARVYRTIVR